MEAVDVARIRTQVRLAELALAGLISENSLAGLPPEPVREAEALTFLDQALENLEYSKANLTAAIDKLNAGKPPRDRG